jgi:hypothetical protein
VTETKLFDQEGVVAKHAGGVLRAREWGDWVSHVSDDENWDLEFRGGERRKFLNRTNGPFIQGVAK